MVQSFIGLIWPSIDVGASNAERLRNMAMS
jgi:hypothetical protein